MTQENKCNELPICLHDQFCGGCIYQDLEYCKQAIVKGKEVARLMEQKEVDLKSLEEPFTAEQLIKAPKLIDIEIKWNIHLVIRLKMAK